MTSDPVAAALASYQRAVHAKDMDGFLELFANDAVVFDAWDAWEYELGAWRTMVQDWFGSLGSEKVLVEVSGLRSHADGDLACGHASCLSRPWLPTGTAFGR